MNFKSLVKKINQVMAPIQSVGFCHDVMDANEASKCHSHIMKVFDYDSNEVVYRVMSLEMADGVEYDEYKHFSKVWSRVKALVENNKMLLIGIKMVDSEGYVAIHK